MLIMVIPGNDVVATPNPPMIMMVVTQGNDYIAPATPAMIDDDDRRQ